MINVWLLSYRTKCNKYPTDVSILFYQSWKMHKRKTMFISCGLVKDLTLMK